MSDNSEWGLEDKLQLPENCGLTLRQYFYFIGAGAVLILIGTYWFINHYQHQVHGPSILKGLGLSGVDAQMVAGAPAAVNAPNSFAPQANAPTAVPGNNMVNNMGNGQSFASTQTFTPNQAMAQNIAQLDFASVAMDIRNSVVNISTTSGAGNLLTTDKTAAAPDTVAFANPFSPRSRGSIGSGVIVRDDGYIISNYHIVRGANSAIVTVFNNAGTQRFKADVVKMDEAMDLVLMKIKTPTPLVAAQLADSAQVRVADEVIAIGSPFGLDQTVSRGIVSALRKSLAIEGITHSDLIQTDAAINQGNSGGPLVGVDGQVIGINTAIYTPTGAFAGIGFAIPSNQVRKFMMDEMGEPMSAARSFTVAAPNTAPPVISANAKAPGNHRTDGRSGMTCTNCHQVSGGGQVAGQPVAFLPVAAPNTPPPVISANANTPGNHRGDGRANMACNSCHQISGQPAGQAGGQAAALQFTQPATSLAVNVALAQAGAATFGVPGANYTFLGAGVMPISAALAERLNRPQDRGVFVSQVVAGSPSAEAGLKAGDIILKVGGRRIWAPGQLGDIIKDMTAGEMLRVGVLRNDQRFDVDLVVVQMPVAANQNQFSAVVPARAVPNEFNWRGINIENFVPVAPPANPGEPSIRGAEIDGVTKASAAEKAGLMARDVILKVNSEPVGKPVLLDQAIQKSKGQTSILLLVMRNGREFFVVLP